MILFDNKNSILNFNRHIIFDGILFENQWIQGGMIQWEHVVTLDFVLCDFWVLLQAGSVCVCERMDGVVSAGFMVSSAFSFLARITALLCIYKGTVKSTP